MTFLNPALMGSELLGESWDLASKVISTLVGIIEYCIYSFLTHKKL